MSISDRRHAPAPARGKPRFYAAGCACIACLVIASALTVRAVEPPTMVAVMPFANLSKDPSLDWLSEGISETLTVKLSGTERIRLVERLRIESLLKEQALGQTGIIDAETAVSTGKMLGAETVVAGAYQAAGSELRLTARFLSVRTGLVSHTAMATGPLSDIFALEDRIADAMLMSLGRTPSTAELAAVHGKVTSSLDAYRNFSEGVMEIKKGNYDEAKAKLDRAVEEDPSFTLARENLAYVEWARPSSNASIYMRKVAKPFSHTYDAMERAVKSLDGLTVKSLSRNRGTIEVTQPLTIWSVGQDIQIEIKDLGTVSGVRILSQTQETFLGIRQVFDWGESRRSIEAIIDAFERSL